MNLRNICAFLALTAAAFTPPARAFDNPNIGKNPEAGLVQGADGAFYGTTSGGGTNNLGTVFRVTAAGDLTTLVNFTGSSGTTHGARPLARLTIGSDGNFFTVPLTREVHRTSAQSSR